MIGFALISLAGAGVLAWSGGLFGWTFAVVYAWVGLDMLWFYGRLTYLRRRAR